MSADNRKEVLRNVNIVWFAYIVLAVAILGKICYIAFVKGDYYKQKGKDLYVKERTIEADRGNIFSDDKTLLATSLPIFEIRFDPLASKQYLKEMKEKTKPSEWSKYDIFAKNIDSLSICISKYLKPSLTPAQIKKWIVAKRGQEKRYLLIAKDVPYETLVKVKQFPMFRMGPNISGLIIKQSSKRIMPYGDLALRTIGYTRDNAQPIGLEGYYDKSLKGEVGKRLMQFVKPNAWIPINDLTEIEPRNGEDIVTTINVQMQDIATSALRDALKYHNADNGTVIVMDVKSGAIKAISNLSKSGDSYVESFNLAIGHAIEPGSTFKLASVMAMLEDNKFKLTDSIDLNYGKAVISGREMKDSEPHHYRWATLQRAFEISSNVGISKAVVKAYGQNHDDVFQYIKRLK
ncbi:MAG TPA: penicillin-binding transpeptidase domain-containing protein, partial [Saprospiraceae bacterium]|nr:penicillin-binding transpeptidase domain-containing protein [Saprospiraceae bacterium]